jgi:catechol 2,3-dioxygenase-like lactoylglutathione lyase family enzyme
MNKHASRILITIIMAFLLQGITLPCLAEESGMVEEKTEEKIEQTEKQVPKINVKFVYSLCNDIEAMRHFYTDLLGMEEIAFYSDEEQKFGYLSYLCAGGLEFDFFYTGQEVAVQKDWSWQPGYEGGTSPITSWSVQIPEADFPTVVARLQKDGVKSFNENPFWCLDSYWAFPVADPQGYTVEVYSIPAQKPASTQWPAE